MLRAAGPVKAITKERDGAATLDDPHASGPTQLSALEEERDALRELLKEAETTPLLL